MRSRSLLIPLALGALVAAALACNFSIPSATVPSASAPCSVTTSPAAANRLVQRIQAAAQKHGQPVTISATSDELSSLLAQSLEEARARDPQNALDISNTSVCFKDGKMTLTGTLKPDGKTPVDAQIGVTAAARDGKVSVDVVDMQLGPFPVPAALRDQVTAQINQALNDNINGITITDVTISDGQMTLTGTAP